MRQRNLKKIFFLCFKNVFKKALDMFLGLLFFEASTTEKKHPQSPAGSPAAE
jgi:hypothetical protein